MVEDLAGQRITVMGLGRFGGGVGVTRWLAARGARVLLTDVARPEALAASLARIDDLVADGRVQLRLGTHHASDFAGIDLVVANPAVPRPWENEHLETARSAGVPVTTEIRLVCERIDRDRVIGVTGSAGKSTTAAMIHHALGRAGVRAHLGGNIGGSLLDTLDAVAPDDWIVLELSSAMLHWLGAGVGFPSASAFSPRVAVWTNLEPNHLDWHGTLAHYERSKRNIFAAQEHGDHALRGDDVDSADGTSIPLLLPGAHNQVNARLALAAVGCVTGLDPASRRGLLDDFAGLPHRLRLVAERDGMRYYDDSKSTTPRAAVLAVSSFSDPSRVHLIAGGHDKQIDLSAIAAMTPRLAGLYAIGATGATLVAQSGGGRAEYCGDLDAAVARASSRMTPGDLLLLSPGCASWDQFDNFEARGKAFAKAVQKMGPCLISADRRWAAEERIGK